jgi:hypothetical protein
MLYVDPLGKVTELNTKLNEKILEGSPQGTPLVYNYTNKIHNLRKNNILNNARLEDIEKKNASNKINFIIYSIFACIFIIMFLVFLRKLNR